LHINDNIRKARELKGLSQADISKLLDEKRSTYAEWEKETVPRADIFFKLAAVLGVKPDDLISENWNPDEISARIPVSEPLHNGRKKPSLETISADLEKILIHQIWTRAEIRSFGEYQVAEFVQGDKDRKEAIMEQINNLVAVNVRAVAREGIRGDGGS
jgi:transcriptional regulator with XRE-family HTH domain